MAAYYNPEHFRFGEIMENELTIESDVVQVRDNGQIEFLMEQIIKGYKTEKLDDILKDFMSFVAGGAFLWIIYGIEKDDPYIIGVNVAAIVLTMIVLTMKFRYDKYKTS